VRPIFSLEGRLDSPPCTCPRTLTRDMQDRQDKRDAWLVYLVYLFGLVCLVEPPLRASHRKAKA